VESEPAKNVGGRPIGALGTRGRRWRLIAGFTEALGGSDRITALQLEDIHRAADLVALAAAARAAALVGKESLGNVTRLEIQASKAVRRLNLPSPGNSAAPVRTFAELVAGHEGDG
jgi:hypothetical protein